MLLKRCVVYFICSDDGNSSVECEVEKASISLGEDVALNRESAAYWESTYENLAGYDLCPLQHNLLETV